jgi:hypothetical protein
MMAMSFKSKAQRRALASVASKTRKASASEKKKNPNLKKVKG